MSYFTQKVVLNNNKLSGQIPAEVALAGSLKYVDLRNNTLSCSGSGPSNSSSQCGATEQLPCFLRLSANVQPLPDASNMECPLVERKQLSDAFEDCKGEGPTKLVGGVGALTGCLTMY